MQSDETGDSVPRTGIATYAVEVIVALGVLGMGLVVIFGSRALGSGWTSDGPGAGYFPFWIGVILCIAGIGTVYQAIAKSSRNTSVFVDGEQLKRVLSVFIPAVIYVGVVQLVGLYLASTIYIAGFMVLLGKYSWIKSIVVAVAIMVLLFFMFEVWFKVPLFKGQFNPLGFLGY
jgi:Tripartite tricarboxylate transporter TctB family